MNKTCENHQQRGHISKVHHHKPQYSTYEPNDFLTEEITIIDSNIEINVGFITLIDLLAIDVSVKKNREIIVSRLFKESSALKDNKSSFIVLEGKHQIQIEFDKKFEDRDKTSKVSANINISRENKRLFSRVVTRGVTEA